MDAGSLNCPHCGAAVTSDAPSCPYCHSVLQTVACTRCLAMMFAGSRFCPRCGAAAAGIVSSAKGHRCPCCRTPMSRVRIGKFDADACTGCGGMWLSPGVFDALCADAEARSAASGLALANAGDQPGTRHPTSPAPTALYRPCPECGQPMGRINYAHRSGVIIDVCRRHGLWLERSEMSRIVDFIGSGGLERARQLEKEALNAARRNRELDRQIEGSPSRTELPQRDE